MWGQHRQTWARFFRWGGVATPGCGLDNSKAQTLKICIVIFRYKKFLDQKKKVKEKERRGKGKSSCNEKLKNR